MLRVAVLGSGFMGGTHARAFAALPDVKVVGVSSRSAEKAGALAATVGAQPFDDALALATHADVDAVSITLPTYLHAEYAVAALKAGKHVLLEKPMALTLEECDAISAAAAQSRGILMLAHVLRFWPEYIAVADLVQSGALGKPQSAMAWRHLTHPAWADWFNDASLSGGEVLDLHIHDLDALNWLFGAPASIYARGTRGPSGGFDHAISLLAYNGVNAIAEGTSLMPAGYPFSMLLTVRCEGGVIEYVLRAGGEQVDSADAGQNSLLVYRPGQPPQPLACTPGDPYALEITAFVRAAQSGVAPANGTPAQGRLAVATALAARRSIETGAVVTV